MPFEFKVKPNKLGSKSKKTTVGGVTPWAPRARVTSPHVDNQIRVQRGVATECSNYSYSPPNTRT